MRNLTMLVSVFAFTIFAWMPMGPGAQASSRVETFLKDKEATYPDCVSIVRNQLFLIPDEQRVAMMPYLFDTCVSGRKIGERRTKEMYDIPPAAKPKKKPAFKFQVQPPTMIEKD